MIIPFSLGIIAAAVRATITPPVVQTYDPMYNDVLLHMPFDTSTTYDVASNTVARSGSISIDSGTYLYGSGSLHVPASGYLSVAQLPALLDYTIEFSVNLVSYASGMITRANGGSDYLNIRFDTNELKAFGPDSRSVALTTQQMSDWLTIAVVREGATGRIFINGSLEWSGAVSTTSLACNLQLFGAHDLQSIDGLVDNIRITGRARYQTNYIPGQLLSVPFDNNSLLIPFDGVASTTTAVDLMGGVVTLYNGPSTQYSVKKFGNAAAKFNGSGWIQVESSPVFGFGLDDFTIELWFNATQTQSLATLLTREWMSNPWDGGYTLMLNGSGNEKLTVYAANYSTSSPMLVSSVGGHTDGGWHHVAWVRCDHVHTLYLDGNSVASITSTFTIPTVQKHITLGNDQTFDGGSRGFNGYMDEVRITKGLARYTSNFTPTKITSLPPSPSQYIPVDPHWNDVTMLLHMDSGHNSTLFVDERNNAITRAGNCVQSAKYPFSGTSCMLFDGSSWLYVDPWDGLTFGSSPFTIECFVRPDSVGGIPGLFSRRNNSSSYCSWELQLVSGGLPQLLKSNQAITDWETILAYTDVQVIPGMWQHIAMVADGTRIYLFVNGKKSAVSATYTPFQSTNERLFIGRGGDGAIAGRMDEIRITKGVARYATDFTPPSVPFYSPTPTETTDTYISSVTSLLHMNGTVGDTTTSDLKGNVVSFTNGTVLAADAPFSNRTSAFFSGNGAGCSIASGGCVYGTGPFTVECWIKAQTAINSYAVIMANQTAGGFSFCITNDGRLTLGRSMVGTDVVTSPVVQMGEWAHVAYSYRPGTIMIFVNGTQIYVTEYTISFPSGNVWVGVDGNGSSYPYHGHIAELRMTQGVARYSQSFIPPTLPFADA